MQAYTHFRSVFDVSPAGPMENAWAAVVGEIRAWMARKEKDPLKGFFFKGGSWTAPAPAWEVTEIQGLYGPFIFTERNIANVVERVLDGPVAPAESLELSGVHFGGWTTGEEDFGFFGNAKGLEMMSGAAHHRRLDGVRESRALRSDLKGIDRTGFMSAVALVQSDVRREKKRRSRPWIARRVYRRVWVDCL